MRLHLGVDPRLTRQAALKEQVAETRRRIELFIGQGRQEGEIRPLRERLASLESLA